MISFGCSVRRPYGFKVRRILAMPSKGAAVTRHGPGRLSVASSAGIDVGKQYLNVGFFPAVKPLRVVNEPTGIAKIVSVLRARGVGRVVLEGDRLLCAQGHLRARRGWLSGFRRQSAAHQGVS